MGIGGPEPTPSLVQCWTTGRGLPPGPTRRCSPRPESPAPNTQPPRQACQRPLVAAQAACLSPEGGLQSLPTLCWGRPPTPLQPRPPLPLHAPPTGPPTPPSEPSRCGLLLAQCLPLPLTGRLRLCRVPRPGTGPRQAEGRPRLVEELLGLHADKTLPALQAGAGTRPP